MTKKSTFNIKENIIKERKRNLKQNLKANGWIKNTKGKSKRNIMEKENSWN